MQLQNTTNKKEIVLDTMKNITIYLFFLLNCTNLIGQSYTTAAGLRIGDGIGVSVQQKIAKFSTIEAILKPSINSDITSIDILYEHHQRVISKRFNIYMGGGLHKAWYSETSDDFGKANAGLTGIIGGEFSFKKINVSWDYKPTADFLGGDDDKLNLSHGTAVSLRYIIVPQKKNEDWKIWKKETREKRKEDKAKKKKKEERKKRRKEAGWKFWEW